MTIQAREAPLRDVLDRLARETALLAQLTRPEIEGRYRGSLLGAAWSFATPVAFLGIYTFVFGQGLNDPEPRSPTPTTLAAGDRSHGAFAR